jgi:hypothetical protein
MPPLMEHAFKLSKEVLVSVHHTTAGEFEDDAFSSVVPLL